MHVLAVAFLRDDVKLPTVDLFAPGGRDDEVVSSYGVISTGRYSVPSMASDLLKLDKDSKGFVSNFAYQVSQHRCLNPPTCESVSQLAPKIRIASGATPPTLPNPFCHVPLRIRCMEPKAP